MLSGPTRSVALGFAMALGLISLLPVSAVAESWPQWRGPARDGHAPMFEVPGTWPETPQPLWKVEVGEGYASPVVVGETIYLITRQGDDEVVMALNLSDGKALWSQRFPTPYKMHQAAIKHGQGPKATPVVADGVVCFLGIDARFTCHDAGNGKLLWQRDFSERTAEVENFCGSSMSPLVDDGVVYVHLGDDRGGRLFAADLHSGEELWGWEGQGPGYASPIMLTIDGQRTLVTLATTHLLGFDPANGELLWERPYADKWRENIVTPIVIGQHLIISDYQNGTLSVWPERTADGWNLVDQWHNEELTQRMSSPVSDGKLLYGHSNRNKGQLFILDPANGEVLWQNEGRAGEHAVLTLANDLLLVTNTDAELVVYATGANQLRPLETYSIADSPVWSHPAWLQHGLLVKDAQHLSRLALVAPPQPKTPQPKTPQPKTPQQKETAPSEEGAVSKR